MKKTWLHSDICNQINDDKELLNRELISRYQRSDGNNGHLSMARKNLKFEEHRLGLDYEKDGLHQIHLDKIRYA